jgi:hypothetical protein
MDSRLETRDSFRQAVTALGLPLTDEELDTTWAMARDLRVLADSLARFLDAKTGQGSPPGADRTS